MGKTVACAFLILALAGYWVFSALIFPPKLRARVCRALSGSTGLSLLCRGAHRLSPTAFELRGADVRVSGETVLAAPVVRFETGRDFSPPYAFTCVDAEVRLNLGRDWTRAGALQWKRTRIRLRRSHFGLVNLPGLGGTRLDFPGVEGVLVVSEAAGGASPWSGKGTFGPYGARFALSGAGFRVENVKLDTVGRTPLPALAALLGLDPPLPLPLLVDGEAEVQLTYRPDRSWPLRLGCSLIRARPGTGKAFEASGHISLGFESAGQTGPRYRGNFHLRELRLREFLFERVTGTVEGKGLDVTLDNLRGWVCNGRFEGNLRFSAAEDGSLALRFKLTDGDAAAFPAQVIGSPLPFRGNLGLSFRLEAAPVFGETDPVFFGSGRLLWTGAELGLLPFISGIERYVVLSRGLSFDRVRADFRVTNEGIVIHDGEAQSALFRLTVARPSAVRFDRTVDLEFLVERSEREERKFPVFTKLSRTMKEMFLKPFEDHLRLRIRVQGPLDGPTYSLPPPRD
jgi:hypothetical protein